MNKFQSQKNINIFIYEKILFDDEKKKSIKWLANFGLISKIQLNCRKYN